MLQPKCRDLANTLVWIYGLVAAGNIVNEEEWYLKFAEEEAEKAGAEKILSPDIVNAITSQIQKTRKDIIGATFIEPYYDALEKSMIKIMFDSVVACECSRVPIAGR